MTTTLPLPTRRPGAPVPLLGPGAAAAVVVGCGLALAAVWRTAVATATGQQLDTAVMTTLAGVPGVVVRGSDALLGAVGAGSVALVLVVLAAVALARGDVRREVAAAAVLLGANVTTQALKAALVRPELGEGTANSLPSGHVTLLASLAVAAALVVAPRARPGVAAAGALVVAATGLAVVVAQWHRPSDVVAALLVVAGWTAAAAVLVRR